MIDCDLTDIYFNENLQDKELYHQLQFHTSLQIMSCLFGGAGYHFFSIYIFCGVKKGEIKLFILSKISTVKTQLISGTEFTSQSSPELSESKNSAQIYFFSSDPLITETQFKDPKSDFRTQNFAVMNDSVAGL